MSHRQPDKMSRRELRLEVKGRRVQESLDIMRLRIMTDTIDEVIGEMLKEMTWGPTTIKVGDDEWIGVHLDGVTI